MKKEKQTLKRAFERLDFLDQYWVLYISDRTTKEDVSGLRKEIEGLRLSLGTEASTRWSHVNNSRDRFDKIDVRLDQTSSKLRALATIAALLTVGLLVVGFYAASK